jgi:hypothetical protein
VQRDIGAIVERGGQVVDGDAHSRPVPMQRADVNGDGDGVHGEPDPR